MNSNLHCWHFESCPWGRADVQLTLVCQLTSEVVSTETSFVRRIKALLFSFNSLTAFNSPLLEEHKQRISLISAHAKGPVMQSITLKKITLQWEYCTGVAGAREAMNSSVHRRSLRWGKSLATALHTWRYRKNHLIIISCRRRYPRTTLLLFHWPSALYYDRLLNLSLPYTCYDVVFYNM